MVYQATVIKVMIASPSDVNEERQIAQQAILDWNSANSDSTGKMLHPILWETHSSPAMGDRPQAIINKQILRDCDLLIAVFWTRLGTPTGEYVSGTVEEIEEHIKAGKPAMLYFSNAPLPPREVDAEQQAAVRQIESQYRARGLCESYSSLDEFRDKVRRQIALTIRTDEYLLSQGVASVVDDSAMIASESRHGESLSAEAKQLLTEAVEDSNGTVMRFRSSRGVTVQTNSKQFVVDQTPRQEAIWEGAVEELVERGLIRDQSGSGKVFFVTRPGYEAADQHESMSSPSDKPSLAKANIEVKQSSSDKSLQLSVWLENHSGRVLDVLEVDFVRPTQMPNPDKFEDIESHDWKSQPERMTNNRKGANFKIPKDDSMPFHLQWTPGSRRTVEAIPPSELQIEIKTPGNIVTVIDGERLKGAILGAMKI